MCGLKRCYVSFSAPYVLLVNTYQSEWIQNWSNNPETEAAVQNTWSWIPQYLDQMKLMVLTSNKEIFFCNSSACYTSDEQGPPIRAGSAPSTVSAPYPGQLLAVGDKVLFFKPYKFDVEVFDNGAWQLADWKVNQALFTQCTVALSAEEFIVIGGVNGGR